MNIKEKIEEILLSEYQYIDMLTVDKLLSLCVMVRNGKLLCDDCLSDGMDNVLVKENKCLSCGQKIEK